MLVICNSKLIANKMVAKTYVFLYSFYFKISKFSLLSK